MTSKGRDAELVGGIEVTETLAYFYFVTDGGSRLVEVEVELRMDERRFSRVVTGEVVGSSAVAQLLAS